MRTLHWYLTRQVIASLLLAMIVFTFFLLLGNVLKQVLDLLITSQATMGLVVRAVGLLIPYVLVFSLPMGLLTATLLVFGRFSADHELTAVRANGISLLSLVMPILLLSVALCALSAWVNTSLAPRCRIAYKDLLRAADLTTATALLTDGRFVKLKDYLVYVGSGDGTEFQKVLIQEQKDDHLLNIFRASRMKLEQDKERNLIYITLYDVNVTHYEGDAGYTSYGEEQAFDPINMSRETIGSYEPKLSEMTAAQLLSKISELKGQGADATPALVQLHRQVSFSFACIGFTLVGIPLGIRAHRRETTVGVFVAVILVIVYYSFITLGQALETQAKYKPWLIVWIPTFLFQLIGGGLLWRANRGT